MKVAVVHDDFIQSGGAERLVLAMLEIWPQADVYATIAADKWIRQFQERGYHAGIKNWRFPNAAVGIPTLIFQLSWLQRFPLKENLFRYYYSLYPLAVESFNFDCYDLVVSSSARYAHGVITKPGTLHIAYINTPARFLWENSSTPQNPLFRPIINWHRVWDTAAAFRPDYIIANSRTPAERIKRYWGRDVDGIIYPFVDLPSGDFLEKLPPVEGDYFVVLSRLNKWKHIDTAIKAFSRREESLFIIGEGPERHVLEKGAGKNIKFLDFISERDKFVYLKSARALIVTQEEDFGISALEANACGLPVIAFKKGGSTELIEEGVNGIFFEAQTDDSLLAALAKFDQMVFNKENCYRSAKGFNKGRFIKELGNFAESSLRALSTFLK